MRITAIVTLFHPTQKQVDNISSYARSVDRVLLCDNSPNSNEKLFNGLENATYIWFGENLGLSLGFNRVLKNNTFQWKDDDYIIFFDQDSSVEKGHILGLLGIYQKLSKLNHNRVGCLGPAYYNESNKKIEMVNGKEQVIKGVYEVPTIITSSMLLQYATIKDIGFFNEKAFLDMADWDLCWRLTAKHYHCYTTNTVVLKHSVGCGEKRFGPLRIRIWRPFRSYYQVRDSLYLLEENYVPKLYRLRLLANLTIFPIINIVALGDIFERWFYIRKGFGDYKKKIVGALPTCQ